ncbi:PREDICTED: sodium-independent sulfate anion transporter-like [Nicrophorus vespilloides]|uniref:Sodium-independent sulfate anion transporter-like n=1 Tax=Nicrophorus vespilloides TaxID=110193 RepID=A0ABM1MJ30_NICVS|nr:PREDICTED: sodium-independent sulfate anion transporter-like [Nicrophorus vespilloides]
MTTDEGQSKMRRFVYDKFRILHWLPQYNRTAFFSDMIAGITVGLTMMPQSIAYASIAELPPHYGLYTAIMGSFVYIFFGTIKQVSIGPSSLMSLLTFSYLNGMGIDYIVLLTFLAGCVELLMGIFNLGFLVDFISAPVTSGFTSATSVIIILAQLKNILGIKFTSVGIFNLMRELFAHLKYAKLSDTCLGVGSMTVLLSIKYISQIDFKNQTLKKAIWYLAICRNALVVLFGCIIAFLFEYNTGEQPFVIAGKITPGLPEFKLPNFSTTNGNETVSFVEMINTLGSSIIVLPIVAVLANVAIAKSFSDGSVFQATQEMMTLGISNILGSFVGAMPTTGAFTRSAVNNASNVQTPMGGLYAGTMILLALSFLTPYFYFIPKPSIAAVLICAVMFMVEYWEIPKLWRCNKFDCFICLVTFCSSLYLGVEVGLAIGVFLNIIPMIKIWTRPEIHTDIKSNGKGNEYLLVKPELGLFFPSVNYMTDTLMTLSVKYDSMPIVLDLKNLVRIDYTGCQMLAAAIKTFKNKSRQLVFLNLKPNVFKALKSVVDVDETDIRTSITDDDIFQNESAIPLLQNEMIIYHNEENEKRKSVYENV